MYLSPRYAAVRGWGRWAVWRSRRWPTKILHLVGPLKMNKKTNTSKEKSNINNLVLDNPGIRPPNSKYSKIQMQSKKREKNGRNWRMRYRANRSGSGSRKCETRSERLWERRREGRGECWEWEGMGSRAREKETVKYVCMPFFLNTYLQ